VLLVDLFTGDLAGIFASVFAWQSSGERRRGGGRIDGLALPAGDA
jgi:hypothetical protein